MTEKQKIKLEMEKERIKGMREFENGLVRETLGTALNTDVAAEDSVFMIAGILSALGAIVNCSWLMTARADAGSGMEMNAITVAMLGGISAVKGGRGHLAGVIIGTVIITMLNSGMQIAGINSMWILAVTGLILIISIVMNSGMSRFVERMTKV